jgi:hypothetical protein
VSRPHWLVKTRVMAGAGGGRCAAEGAERCGTRTHAHARTQVHNEPAGGRLGGGLGWRPRGGEGGLTAASVKECEGQRRTAADVKDQCEDSRGLCHYGSSAGLREARATLRCAARRHVCPISCAARRAPRSCTSLASSRIPSRGSRLVLRIPTRRARTHSGRVSLTAVKTVTVSSTRSSCCACCACFVS